MNLSADETADVPPGPITFTSTMPAVSAGSVAVICVPAGLITTLVAATVPNLTAVAPLKPVPVIVTDVLPAAGPCKGLTAVTAGGAMYVNLSAEEVADVPPGPTTVTSTIPAVPAGLVAVICVPAALTTTLVAGVEPKLTAVAPIEGRAGNRHGRAAVGRARRGTDAGNDRRQVQRPNRTALLDQSVVSPRGNRGGRDALNRRGATGLIPIDGNRADQAVFRSGAAPPIRVDIGHRRLVRGGSDGIPVSRHRETEVDLRIR